MYWNHKANPEWLAARKNFLTASEIVKLLPTTPTGRPRADLDAIRFKIWATKQCLVSDADIESTGVMARGHIMERYAIMAYNNRYPLRPMHHWDDCLIYNAVGVAMSPDGLDVAQPEDCPVALASCDAEGIIEVKSYKADAHYECGMDRSPGLLMERWQIAVAMYVMPTIEYGALAFFNPSADHPLFLVEYDRKKLDEEIDTIEEIGVEYWSRVDDFQEDADLRCDEDQARCCMHESEIVAELLEEESGQSLNP